MRMPGGAAAETGHSGGNHVLSLDADRPAAHTPQEPPTPPSSPPAKLLGFAAGSFYGEPPLPFLPMPKPPAQVERLTTPRPPRAPMARDLEAMHQRLFTLQREYLASARRSDTRARLRAELDELEGGIHRHYKRLISQMGEGLKIKLGSGGGLSIKAGVQIDPPRPRKRAASPPRDFGAIRARAMSGGGDVAMPFLPTMQSLDFESAGTEAEAEVKRPVRSWPGFKVDKKAENKNKPADYPWLVEAFEAICGNTAHRLGASTEDGAAAIPLFVVGGACPQSGMFGQPMQVVMYFQCTKAVRFWWVKPDPSDKKNNTLGKMFLSANKKGKYKNLAGSMASGVYNPLVTFFEAGVCETNKALSFHKEVVDGCLRACITVDGKQLWLYLVWQEDWSSAIASTKYIKGNIAYQQHPREREFYIRPYDITGDKLSISPAEQGPFGPSVLPSEVMKQMA